MDYKCLVENSGLVFWQLVFLLLSFFEKENKMLLVRTKMIVVGLIFVFLSTSSVMAAKSITDNELATIYGGYGLRGICEWEGGADCSSQTLCVDELETCCLCTQNTGWICVWYQGTPNDCRWGFSNCPSGCVKGYCAMGICIVGGGSPEPYPDCSENSYTWCSDWWRF
jgi:bacteriocin-like protein